MFKKKKKRINMEIDFVGYVVLKFESDTCAPCKKLNPIVDKMKNEFENVKIYIINIEKEYKLAKQFKIMSLPTLLFFNGEKEVSRLEGLVKTDIVRKSFKNLCS
jgi:thioredoxin 1